MKIYGMGDENLVEITKLIDSEFTRDMRVLAGGTAEYCTEKIGETAARLKENICLYIDLKQKMCNSIIDES